MRTRRGERQLAGGREERGGGREEKEGGGRRRGEGAKLPRGSAQIRKIKKEKDRQTDR